jgi:hypothetical protein
VVRARRPRTTLIAYARVVCRSIKTLRPPYTDDVTDADVDAAALQYVRKIAGMRAPSARNQEAFDAAVTEVARATQSLLAGIEVRPASRDLSGRASGDFRATP